MQVREAALVNRPHLIEDEAAAEQHSQSEDLQVDVRCSFWAVETLGVHEHCDHILLAFLENRLVPDPNTFGAWLHCWTNIEATHLA